MPTLFPSAVQLTRLTGSLANFADDPASPDVSWALAQSEQVTVSWTAPSPATDIDRYRVSWYTGGYFVNSTIVSHVGGTTAYSEQIGGLPPATYEFFVTSIKTDNQESDPVSVGTAVVS
jgi:hypothetical protein